ncbi:tRNA methyltransferase [Helicobacter labacensis]|uniref:tRNA methyltransferase n=1 Tax=Helicobacter labacensis TaxID=2316079 RepID=UPI001F48C520|nr:tRNA methyltransferase [Helicobacter labacensis]
MIRLLLLALLLLNLQAKENVLTIMIPMEKPQESKNAPFFRAFKALYDHMDKGNQDAVGDPEEDERWDYMSIAWDISKYIKGVIPLAQTAIQHMPLIQEFKPKNKAERRFLAHLKQREMLRALDSIGVYNAYADHPKSATLAQAFLDTAHFLYAPLFNAHKMGLDPIAYIKELRHILVDEKKCHPAPFAPNDYCNDNSTCAGCAYDIIANAYDEDISNDKFLEQLHTDIKNMAGSYGFFQQKIGSRNLWERLTILNIFGDDEDKYFVADDGKQEEIPPSAYVDDDTYKEMLQRHKQRIDPNHLSTLYLARLLVLSHNAPFYTHLKDNPVTILKDHPTMCLSPKYLSPKSQQTCLQLFKTQTYNAKDIQEQLHLVRLISIDESPCVYLDPKDKLQIFKSDNALCVVLQKNLVKEF